MKIIASSMVVYGVELKDKDEMPWDSYHDLDDWYTEFIKNHHLKNYTGKHDEYYEKKQKILTKLNIGLIEHDSSLNPKNILVARDCVFKVQRGQLSIINPDLIKDLPDFNIHLWNFCNEYEIPWKTPKWYLVAHWG